MFTKDERSGEKVETVIGPSVQVEGNFVGEGNIIVQGSVSGTVKTSGDLRVGPNAKIKADVEAKNIFTAGEITGTQLTAREKLEVEKTSRINANIKAAVLSVEPGAIINGKIKMTGSVENEVLETKNDSKSKEN